MCSTACSITKSWRKKNCLMDIPPPGPEESLEKDGIVLASHALHFEPDAAEQRRVLLKIDLIFLPLASIFVMFQMLDKALLNYVNLMGIQDNIGMRGTQFSWLGTIFFLGYLTGTPIHVWFLQNMVLSRYVSAVLIIWGVVLMCHAACNSFSGLMACRFFLGVLEAGINSAFILLTGRFYKREEQVLRTAIWASSNGWSLIVGGLIAYGILTHPSPYLAMWKELYIAVGAATIGVGVCCIIFLPSSPATTWYLSPRQRSVAVYRIASNQSGIHDSRFKWYQFKEAFMDIRLYLFFLAFACINVGNGGISNFASEIITEFTEEKRENALLGMSQGAAVIVSIIIGTVLFMCLGRRDIPCVFGHLVAVTGTAMMTWLDPSMRVTRMAGLALVNFFSIAYPMLYSWQTSAVAGTTKRIIFNSNLQVAYCVGNAVGPQAFAEKDKPNHYLPGKINMLAMYAASAMFISLVSLVHWKRNQKRTDVKLCDEEDFRIALSDLTDMERLTYKYAY